MFFEGSVAPLGLSTILFYSYPGFPPVTPGYVRRPLWGDLNSDKVIRFQVKFAPGPRRSSIDG